MILDIQSISKNYGQGDILKDLSLQVNAGETLAITGPSGSGKTSLLNMIAGLDKPGSGSIFFEGKEINSFSGKELAQFRNTRIGFVFQMHYLLPQCSLFENLLIPTLALEDKTKKKAANNRAMELLERAGLTRQKDQYPGELSGGECQRAALIRALINQPGMILADEPTGSLDQETAESLGQLLVDLNQEQGTSLIIVTHSLDLAAKMQTIYHLSHGQLVKNMNIT